MTTTVPAADGSLALPPPRAGRERVPLYVWALLLSLMLNVFSGKSELMGFPVPPDRLLLLGSLTLLILEPRRDRFRWRPVYGFMIALVLWTTWSALTAGTLATASGFYALLDRIVVPFIMFAVAPVVFSSTRRRDLLLMTLTLTGLYLGVISVTAMIGPRSIVFPRYLLDFYALDKQALDDPRAYGPFLSSEATGMAVSLCAFAAGMLWTRTRSVLWRLVIVATIPACLGALVLTLTRSSWLAALVGIALVAFLVPAARKWLVGGVTVAIAGVAMALLAFPSLMTMASDRLTTSRSLYDRANTYEAGWRALAEQPIFGIGWAKFIDIGTEWVRQSPDYPITTVTIEIHNVFLSRAVETGIPGAALWVLVIVLGPLAVLWLQRRHRSGEAGLWWLFLLFALVVWFVPSMTSPNPYPFPNYIVWLVAGLVGRRALVHNRTTRVDPDGIERRDVPEEA